MVKKKQQSSPTPDELGKMLKNIYESGYLDRTTAYKMSFFKGVFAGLGGVIGATIVVGLLLWTLSLFQDVPVVGRFINNVTNSIETDRN